MNEINHGIRRVVELLRKHGFETCDSGDGETHAHPCDRFGGYVSCIIGAASIRGEANRLVQLLLDHGVRVTSQPNRTDLEILSIGDDEGAHVQASYDPCDGIAILDVENIHDRMLKDQAS